MKFELVFIPYPGIGHLRSTVEMAKLLVARETRLSISVIIPPFISGGEVGASDYVAALSSASNNRLRYEIISAGDEPTAELTSIDIHIKNQVPKVKRAVAKLVDDYSTLPDSTRIVGFVLDMFCTSMIDVANEFGVPSYLFYTSSAGILALGYHIQMLYDENKYDVSESGYLDSEAVLNVPSLNRPYPVKCLPHALASKVWLPMLVNQARKFREMKGILINTVTELEADVLKFLSSGDTPPVYPVGPLLHLENQVDDSKDEKQLDILRWLDEQAPSSVVFLCFGSMGGFGEEQAREIAIALERSGHRFLWSLRRASPNILKEPPREFTNLEEVLPEGFFDRTKDIGKVIGWAPQVAVLANPAIGGFVTHCGWNSTLESLWFGVPTAAWPLYAEQKFNAFEMVEELGLAVEIRKYWRGDHFEGPAMVMVTAEEIETAIKCLMEQDSDVRKRVKEMNENWHAALTDGGSSRIALQKFIEDVTKNIVSMDKGKTNRGNKEMKIELAFIPSPAISHLMATVEMAEQLVDQNDHLSITVIIISFNSKSTSMIFTSLTTTSNKRIRYEINSVGDQQPTELKATDSHIQSLKPLVRDAVAKLVDPTQPDSPRLARFIVDMYCTSMIDVANEFGVPSYLFYTSNAGFLGLLLHIQFMYDSEDTYDMSDLEDSDA